jgi:predicted nucleotidyltransferase
MSSSGIDDLLRHVLFIMAAIPANLPYRQVPTQKRPIYSTVSIGTAGGRVADTDMIISIIQEHGEEIRVEFGVARLGVFGSRVRGEARTDSDLDVLVEFSRPTFRNYMGLKRFLEHLIGVPVDLVSVAALKPLLKEHIMREVRFVA